MPLLLFVQQVPEAVLAQDPALEITGELASFVGFVVPEPLAVFVIFPELPGIWPVARARS